MVFRITRTISQSVSFFLSLNVYMMKAAASSSVRKIGRKEVGWHVYLKRSVRVLSLSLSYLRIRYTHMNDFVAFGWHQFNSQVALFSM